MLFLLTLSTAQSAMNARNEFRWDHLILSVEWARYELCDRRSLLGHLLNKKSEVNILVIGFLDMLVS